MNAPLYAFSKLLVLGAALGLLYDILCELSPVRTFSELVFWSLALCAGSGALFYLTDLTVRFYALLALLLGWLIYYAALRVFVLGMLRGISRALSARGRKVLSRLDAKTAKSRLHLTEKYVLIKNRIKYLWTIPKRGKKVYNRYNKYFSEKRNQWSRKKAERKSGEPSTKDSSPFWRRFFS